MIEKTSDPEVWRDHADFERKRLQESSACSSCGSPDPVRIEAGRCSDCYDGWPKCPICGGWSDIVLHRPHIPTPSE